MLPTVAIGVFPLAILVGDDAMRVRKSGFDFVKKFQSV
jgi:hypothetical protein